YLNLSKHNRDVFLKTYFKETKEPRQFHVTCSHVQYDAKDIMVFNVQFEPDKQIDWPNEDDKVPGFYVSGKKLIELAVKDKADRKMHHLLGQNILDGGSPLLSVDWVDDKGSLKPVPQTHYRLEYEKYKSDQGRISIRFPDELL